MQRQPHMVRMASRGSVSCVCGSAGYARCSGRQKTVGGRQAVAGNVPGSGSCAQARHQNGVQAKTSNAVSTRGGRKVRENAGGTGRCREVLQAGRWQNPAARGRQEVERGRWWCRQTVGASRSSAVMAAYYSTQVAGAARTAGVKVVYSAVYGEGAARAARRQECCYAKGGQAGRQRRAPETHANGTARCGSQVYSRLCSRQQNRRRRCKTGAAGVCAGGGNRRVQHQENNGHIWRSRNLRRVVRRRYGSVTVQVANCALCCLAGGSSQQW